MLILSVPSSGGTVTPDLLPTLFRDLSDALPLAQAVKITRGVAYFHNAAITRPTLVLGLWAAAAVAMVAIAWRRQQSRARSAAAPRVPSLLNPMTAGARESPPRSTEKGAKKKCQASTHTPQTA